MAQLGADVDQLDTMSQKFNMTAEQLQQMVSQLDGLVQSAWWQGSDADNFRQCWTGQFKSQMTNLCSTLQDTGKHVKTQADQQRQTSGA